MKPLRHPEEYTDTDPKAMEAWIRTLRAKSAGERLAVTLGLSELALRMSEAGVRSRFPLADEVEIRLRTAALHLPRELMIAVYGWDPEDHALSG